MLTSSLPKPDAARRRPGPRARPFLIVRPDAVAALRERAGRWPWDEQKAAAIEATQVEQVSPSARIDIRAIVLARVFSTTALAYLLDPDRRAFYVERIARHLRLFDPADPAGLMASVLANADKTLWRYAVPVANAFFQGVLALDIVHDDLPPAERAAIESVLRAGPSHYFQHTKLAWTQGTLAAAAIMPLYDGDADVYEPLVAAWREHTLRPITADGVFVGGCGYADARWTYADRECKALFGDVLVHTGVLPDWYAEPRLGLFQEWLNGYAYTPSRMCWPLGDTGPDHFNPVYQPGNERAYRYSRLAGQYAAWLREGVTPPAGLASYVLVDEPPGEAAAVPSRVFPDGGAWLKESSTDERSLAAVLWNTKTLGDAHAHKETNALCLAAYGETILRGGGYNGWATDEQGFSWDYIHDRAIAANVALFDYPVPTTADEERTPPTHNDHAAKAGAGVTASLLTGGIDFARGDSGDAMANGHHVRDLLFVHPTNDACGYWAVLDRLTAAPGVTGQLVWHPTSARCDEVAPRQEYAWTFDPPVTAETNSRLGLNVFLATPPDATTRHDGVLANWGDGVVGKYLVGHYTLGPTGRRDVWTVLFPHDATHAKADLRRFASDDGTLAGATVRQAGTTDTLFQSDAATTGRLAPDVGVRATAGLVRRADDGRVSHVWLTGATQFACPQFGFESDAPVIVARVGDTLHVHAATSTTVVVTAGVAGFERRLPAGTHRLALPNVGN